MRKFWLSVAAVAAATGLLTGCSGAGDSSDSERDGATPTPRFTWSEEASALDPSRDVRIVKSGFEDHKDWGRHAYVVHYTITNGGSGAANYFVQFEFLDKDDDVLGKTGVTVDRLGPGKTETNDSALLDSEIENGSVEDIASVHVTQVERT